MSYIHKAHLHLYHTYDTSQVRANTTLLSSFVLLLAKPIIEVGTRYLVCVSFIRRTSCVIVGANYTCGS